MAEESPNLPESSSDLPVATAGELERAALEENWKLVDRSLTPETANSDDILRWAKSHVEDENNNLRGLAVRIYEATSRSPSEDMTETLARLRDTDDNPYVRFRSAFALFKHGELTPATIAVIWSALADEDVAERAKAYLDMLEKPAD